MSGSGGPGGGNETVARMLSDARMLCMLSGEKMVSLWDRCAALLCFFLPPLCGYENVKMKTKENGCNLLKHWEKPRKKQNILMQILTEHHGKQGGFREGIPSPPGFLRFA